ncbi:hypothetical protein [Quisquiliibacterium transsilvanicum]|uniref:Porin n=1 Tax=Quisquiliibacterium transsilvanicum TaxID=1549638 RepID=A0A7W8MA61_9BURK|nr:hypothetical protein [Quisquiliibacterium transsilvanicum]MBB5273055.1 hypothetical protein [Quisquiliibacterium transsilvanicum]
MKPMLLALALALTTPLPAGAADPAPKEFAFSADVRLGYFAREREDRDGARSDSDDWRIRIRPGALWQITPELSAKARVAGRYSTDDSNRNHSRFFTSIPASDGLRFGDSTFDEFYLRYKPGDSWDVRVGRMQTSFELEGVAKKSLSRNDSPNTDITWTDGIHVRYADAAGWNYHAILQRSEDEGPTTVRRSPLAFTRSASHLTYYAGMEKKDPKGRILQLGWDLTYIPDALRVDGSATGRIDDHLGITGRLALQWPMAGNMRFVWAGEAGFAPDTPTKAALRLPGSGDASGLAFQTSVNLVDFAPGHSVGLVYGQAGGGWLLSPDFGNNQELLELRYQWRLSAAQSIEARIRTRRDLEQLMDTSQRRVDDDIYVRYTHRF